jgi:hypothetical protein
VQRTTCSGQHATDNMQQTACNRQHATDDMQQAACNRRRATGSTARRILRRVRRTACNRPATTTRAKDHETGTPRTCRVPRCMTSHVSPTPCATAARRVCADGPASA